MDIVTESQLRELYEQPNSRVVAKCLRQLDSHCRAFIALSPFCVVSSFSGGLADASPRGDRPGFVQVLDDHTLAIPDRPGNNRLDTMLNLLTTPAIGIIFFVPGINETLRVNGNASITIDAELLDRMAIEGRVPKAAIRVSVREAYLHCAKALMRSRIWDPAVQVPRSALPSAGRIQAEQLGLDVQKVEREIDEHNRMFY